MARPIKRKGERADTSGDARPMGEFIQYVREDSNMSEFYDEFADAGPIERAELYRCRSIDRGIEYMGDGFGPHYDDADYEMGH